MKYHLRYWTKAEGRTSNALIPAREINRIYVNGQDGSTLGYIERRQIEAERGVDSYYDRHRAARGDTTETATDEVISTLPAGAVEAMVAAAKAHSAAHERALTGELYDLFFALKSFARGINWLCDAKRRKALKKLADTFEFDL